MLFHTIPRKAKYIPHKRKNPKNTKLHKGNQLKGPIFVLSLFYFFKLPLFLNRQRIVATYQISGQIWPTLAIGVFFKLHHEE